MTDGGVCVHYKFYLKYAKTLNARNSVQLSHNDYGAGKLHKYSEMHNNLKSYRYHICKLRFHKILHWTTQYTNSGILPSSCGVWSTPTSLGERETVN